MEVNMNKRFSALLKILALTLIILIGQIFNTDQASVLAAEGEYIPIRLAAATFDPLSESPTAFINENLQIQSFGEESLGYYIVQLKGPVYEADKQQLLNLGAELFDYIPEFSFIARMPPAAAAEAADLNIVRWVGIYQPGYRIAPALMEIVKSQNIVAEDGLPAGIGDPLDINVLIFHGEAVQTIADQIAEMGGTILATVETEWRGKLKVHIQPNLIVEIARIHGVSWVEKAPLWELNNEVAHGNTIMDVADVWNTHGYYGTGQIGAIADTQLDSGNPATVVVDFLQCGNNNPRFTIVALGTATNDFHGHGTHTAGSFMGNGRLAGATCGNYTAYPAGNAPEATGYFQAIMNTDGSLGGIPADLNNLFQPAYTFGARVHSNSWGSAVMGQYTSESQEADQFSWNNKNFLILFSAGNEGVDIDSNGVVDLLSIGAPGTAKNVITVGASENLHPGYGNWGGWEYPAAPINGDDYSNNINGMAAFSSRGPTDDGRYKPDIVAPGVWVNSVRSTYSVGSGNYVMMGGTSMSTPLTAGAALLARQVFLAEQTYAPSAAMLKSALANGATDMYPGQYGAGATQEIPTTRPTFQAGWGRVDLEDSLFPTGGRRTWWWDHTTDLLSSLNNLSTGGSATYSFEVLSSMPLRATLAWTDYPGTLAAAGGLSNDLDFHIVGPGGTYYPNNAKQRLSSQLLDYVTIWTMARRPMINQRFAMRTTPTQYPATLAFAKLWFYNTGASAGSVNFNLLIYNDNGGPGPTGGTVLCTLNNRRAAWGPGTFVYPTIIDLSSCGASIPSGEYYLSLEFTADAPLNSSFLMQNVPGRAWYNTTGTWTQDPTYNYAFASVVYRPVSPSTSYDRGVNNLEGIDIATPPLGTYQLVVNGYNVPNGPQPYALTLSGNYRMLGSETVTRPINGTGIYKFGNTGITINFTSENIDSVAVTVHRDTFPTTGMDSVKRYYEITAAGGTGVFNANVTFGYEQAEFDASGIGNENNLRAYRHNGSTWVEHIPASVDPTNNTVTVNGVSTFSIWALGNPAPTAVRLTDFEARIPSNAALLGSAAVATLLLAGMLLTLRLKRQKRG
jgi:hypothetical protein